MTIKIQVPIKCTTYNKIKHTVINIVAYITVICSGLFFGALLGGMIGLLVECLLTFGNGANAINLSDSLSDSIVNHPIVIICSVISAIVIEIIFLSEAEIINITCIQDLKEQP